MGGATTDVSRCNCLAAHPHFHPVLHARTRWTQLDPNFPLQSLLYFTLERGKTKQRAHPPNCFVDDALPSMHQSRVLSFPDSQKSPWLIILDLLFNFINCFNPRNAKRSKKNKH